MMKNISCKYLILHEHNGVSAVEENVECVSISDYNTYRHVAKYCVICFFVKAIEISVTATL